MDGKVIVISGAASGIGKALCHLLAERGASLGLLDYDSPALQLLTDDLRRNGVRCCSKAVDVRERSKVAEAIQTISDQLGLIDIHISSTGICRASTVDNFLGQEFEKVVLTNLMGTVSLIEATIPSMLARGRGHIIGISSLAGIRGIPYEAGYAASKAAVAAYSANRLSGGKLCCNCKGRHLEHFGHVQRTTPHSSSTAFSAKPSLDVRLSVPWLRMNIVLLGFRFVVTLPTENQ
ncbi:SDR family oxidoreductase [Hyphomicrobium sp. MC1]|uniref:SDR family NAD(P)-dependent oxidoreductase n=1 Tax=Hyphomicrobium sp. (strain MC1) TaxID=717785 RepID=UPI0012F512A5|nr:SDR family NAD(P)-dependent oxidoreductase [Hyphomicrobium sp. MC1]